MRTTNLSVILTTKPENAPRRMPLGSALLLGLVATTFPAWQASAQQTQVPPPTATEKAPGETTEEDVVTVTARKQPENLQKLPLSVTVVPKETLENAGIRSVGEASLYVPNSIITEFTARKLSNPRFRGIGSSPNNPSVTTYIDGVPQLNSNSSSIELLDIDQIEFVRGPQGALFGRNTIGGLINITSTRPSLSAQSGEIVGSLGNYSYQDLRGTFSGPIVEDKSGYRVGFGVSRRNGFTSNTLTGNDVDSRGAFFGKAQMLWKTAENKELRLLLTGERDRDGDYALNDLATVRATPFRVTRDFVGFTSRDVVAPTLIWNSFGRSVDVSLISGIVHWKTQDLTDLDYGPFPLATRNNREKDTQFTQEIRFASSKNAPVNLSDNWKMRWQAGLNLFTQKYDQSATNLLNPPLGPLPGFQSVSQAALKDSGIGAYGQATLTTGEKLDVILGLRGDYERKKATLSSTTVPPFGPPGVQRLSDSFTELSPQIGLAYHLQPNRTVYATISRGFKAGGFNPASPAGTEVYGPEKTLNYEIGAKTALLDNRLTANLAAYYIDWDDLQLNVPFGAPGQFFISNIGNANSKGIELELLARPRPGLELFAGGGIMRARFGSGSTSGGVNVGGNKIPFSPDYTANAGVQYSRSLRGDRTLYTRAEAILYGDYQYDDQNMAGQSSYALANFRAGVRSKKWFAEGWLRNAFDKNYVPVALPYPGLAPSGFVGEPGAPRQFGVSVGFIF